MSPLLLIALASEPPAAPGTARKVKLPGGVHEAGPVEVGVERGPDHLAGVVDPEPQAPPSAPGGSMVVNMVAGPRHRRGQGRRDAQEGSHPSGESSLHQSVLSIDPRMSDRNEGRRGDLQAAGSLPGEKGRAGGFSATTAAPPRVSLRPGPFARLEGGAESSPASRAGHAQLSENNSARQLFHASARVHRGTQPVTIRLSIPGARRRATH